jgi:hypothetical protein
MPGKIKGIIDKIIAERAKGNPTLISTTRTKLVLKGIDPDKFNAQSADDPAIMSKLQTLALEMGINL